MADEHLTLDAVVLRVVADDAASQRAPGGDPGYMVTTHSPEKGWSTRFTTDPPAPSPNQVVTPVNTRTVTPRPAVTSVTLLAEGMRAPLELADKYDAVFWSEAAVEKFLIPYYASKGQWLAAYLLNLLSTVFYGHVPQPAPRESGMVMAEAEEPVPFALAHLPRSDYVGFEEMAPLTANLHVLVVKEGELSARPLSYYLQ